MADVVDGLSAQDAVEFKVNIVEGRPEANEGFWWVRVQGKLRVAEFVYQPTMKKGEWLWMWSLTRAEEADLKAAEPVAFIHPPEATPCP